MFHLKHKSVYVLLLYSLSAIAQMGTESGEWRHYGGDLYSSKYAPLEQIDASNFDSLEMAWQWQTADAFLSQDTAQGEWWAPSSVIFDQLQKEDPERWRGGRAPRLSSLKATPLMVDGILYLCTPLYQGVAVDARSGQTLWVYNPKSYESGTPTMSLMWNARGVDYWTNGDESRIYWGTGDGYLIAVDAKTGQPCADFGENGRVDLTIGIPRAQRGGKDELGALLYSMASPPLVVGDTIVTGSSISDRRNVKETPPGDVRGWDVRTGKLKWTFHTIPHPGEVGHDTWEDGSWEYTGNANVWSMMSADPELGYIYLPTGTPTNDFYGGHRPGDNLFAESLICLNADTGERIWHFQMVHHGVWDYDNPAAPNLLDIKVDGKTIKAVAQVTKQGFVYAFNRVTGEPIWPIDERPVYPSSIPGEKLSETQPFPSKPLPFSPQGVREDDLINFTPELRAKALEELKKFQYQATLFAAPSLHQSGGTQGTIQRPSLGGGANWGGAAVDPETGYLFIPSRDSITVTHYYEPDPKGGGTVQYTHGGRGPRPQGPEGLPFFKPPYSTMTAINLNTGEHVWQVPLGRGSSAIHNHPLLKDLDLPDLGGEGSGGPLCTKTLLISGRSSRDEGVPPRLVAYDKSTGKEVGAVELPARPAGTPMTYSVGDTQYIAVTVYTNPPSLVAYALP